MRCKLFRTDTGITEGGEELISVWRKCAYSRLWVDVEFADTDDMQQLLTDLGCHPLAIQDALRKRHPPKVEAFDEHLFILYRGILSYSDSLTFEHQQVALFVANDLIITIHPGRSLGVDHVWSGSQSLLEKGSYEVALAVMLYAAGRYLDAILQFEGELTDLEDALQAHGNDEMLGDLTIYRSRLLKLRRIFKYHQNITENLLEISEPCAGIDLSEEHTKHLTNDLHERFERLHSLTQMHYEICGDLIEGYLSIASHQLNVTMRILTVITAVFVPLGFMAGLYGMNFEYMPELKFKYGYYFLLGAMVACAAALIFFFKRRRWF